MKKTFPEKPLILSLLIVTVLTACNRHAPTSGLMVSRIAASTLRPARGEVSTVQPGHSPSVKPKPSKQVTLSFSSHYTGLVKLTLNKFGTNTASIQNATVFYIRLAKSPDASKLASLTNKHLTSATATIDDANDGMLYQLYDVQVAGKYFAKPTGRHAQEIWITLKVGFLRYRCGPPYCKKVTWGLCPDLCVTAVAG